MVKARNPGPFTLDGTRSFLIGERQVAVIDPGPDDEEHIRALATSLRGAQEIRILLTHSHSDHAGGAPGLCRVTGGTIHASASLSLGETFDGHLERLRDGDGIPTDHGGLDALETPGHSRDHLAFLWRKGEALFVGDLLLGRGDTTWVGEYPGCVEDYLESLRRIESQEVSVLYPSHGAPIESPAFTVERFRRHRLARLGEIQKARQDHPAASVEELAEVVYGREIPPSLRKAARGSVEAAIFHLDHFEQGG